MATAFRPHAAVDRHVCTEETYFPPKQADLRPLAPLKKSQRRGCSWGGGTGMREPYAVKRCAIHDPRIRAWLVGGSADAAHDSSKNRPCLDKIVYISLSLEVVNCSTTRIAS